MMNQDSSPVERMRSPQALYDDYVSAMLAQGSRQQQQQSFQGHQYGTTGGLSEQMQQMGIQPSRRTTASFGYTGGALGMGQQSPGSQDPAYAGIHDIQARRYSEPFNPRGGMLTPGPSVAAVGAPDAPPTQAAGAGASEMSSRDTEGLLLDILDITRVLRKLTDNLAEFPGHGPIVAQLADLCSLQRLTGPEARAAVQRTVLIAGHEIPRRLLKTVAATCATPQTMANMYSHPDVGGAAAELAKALPGMDTGLFSGIFRHLHIVVLECSRAPTLQHVLQALTLLNQAVSLCAGALHVHGGFRGQPEHPPTRRSGDFGSALLRSDQTQEGLPGPEALKRQSEPTHVPVAGQSAQQQQQQQRGSFSLYTPPTTPGVLDAATNQNPAAQATSSPGQAGEGLLSSELLEEISLVPDQDEPIIREHQRPFAAAVGAVGQRKGSSDSWMSSPPRSPLPASEDTHDGHGSDAILESRHGNGVGRRHTICLTAPPVTFAQAVLEQTALAAARAKQAGPGGPEDRLSDKAPREERPRRGSDLSVQMGDRYYVKKVVGISKSGTDMESSMTSWRWLDDQKGLLFSRADERLSNSAEDWETVTSRKAAAKEGLSALEWQKRPQPFRARMCEHMVGGKCMRPGGNCYFAHTEPELARWKSLFAPTKQCSGGSAHKAQAGECPHSHTPAEQADAIKKYLRARSEALRRMHGNA